jgi:hypothetical protein
VIKLFIAIEPTIKIVMIKAIISPIDKPENKFANIFASFLAVGP